MSDLDTLRWGDATSLKLMGVPAATAIRVRSSQQLVAAHWRWPILWGLRVVITHNLDPAETATFTIRVLVTMGSGQNSSTAIFTYILAPTAGVYPECINDFLNIPAQDIQVTVEASGAAAIVTDYINVGVYSAPVTEPHATTRMYEAMIEGQGGQQRWIDDQRGPTNQNPNTNIAFPINPTPLHYQPR